MIATSPEEGLAAIDRHHRRLVKCTAHTVAQQQLEREREHSEKKRSHAERSVQELRIQVQRQRDMKIKLVDLGEELHEQHSAHRSAFWQRYHEANRMLDEKYRDVLVHSSSRFCKRGTAIPARKTTLNELGRSPMVTSGHYGMGGVNREGLGRPASPDGKKLILSSADADAHMTAVRPASALAVRHGDGHSRIAALHDEGGVYRGTDHPLSQQERATSLNASVFTSSSSSALGRMQAAKAASRRYDLVDGPMPNSGITADTSDVRSHTPKKGILRSVGWVGPKDSICSTTSWQRPTDGFHSPQGTTTDQVDLCNQREVADGAAAASALRNLRSVIDSDDDNDDDGDYGGNTYDKIHRAAGVESRNGPVEGKGFSGRCLAFMKRMKRDVGKMRRDQQEGNSLIDFPGRGDGTVKTRDAWSSSRRTSFFDGYSSAGPSTGAADRNSNSIADEAHDVDGTNATGFSNRALADTSLLAEFDDVLVALNTTEEERSTQGEHRKCHVSGDHCPSASTPALLVAARRKKRHYAENEKAKDLGHGDDSKANTTLLVNASETRLATPAPAVFDSLLSTDIDYNAVEERNDATNSDGIVNSVVLDFDKPLRPLLVHMGMEQQPLHDDSGEVHHSGDALQSPPRRHY